MVINAAQNLQTLKNPSHFELMRVQALQHIKDTTNEGKEQQLTLLMTSFLEQSEYSNIRGNIFGDQNYMKSMNIVLINSKNIPP